VKKLLALSMFLVVGDPGGATNSVPPLIIKGVVNTNAVQWSPWSSWWLRPATNIPRCDGAHSESDTNSLSEAPHLREGETNSVKESEQAVSDVETSQGSTGFGATIISGRPIGRPNVGMGQQTLQPGKPSLQMGPNNMQMAPAIVKPGGPAVGTPVAGAAATGAEQSSGLMKP